MSRIQCEALAPLGLLVDLRLRVRFAPTFASVHSWASAWSAAAVLGSLLGLSACASTHPAVFLPAGARAGAPPTLSPDPKGLCRPIRPSHPKVGAPFVLDLKTDTTGEEPRFSLRVPPARRGYRAYVSRQEDWMGGRPERQFVLELEAPLATPAQVCFPFLVEEQDLVPDASRTHGGLAFASDGSHVAVAENASRSIYDYWLQSEVADLLGAVPMALPAEPVGAGATWEARNAYYRRTLRVDRHSTYRLLSVSPERAVIDLELDDETTPQQYTGPNSGDFEPVQSARVRARGRFTLTPGAPLPSGTLTWTASTMLVKGGEPERVEHGSSSGWMRYELEAE